MSEGPGRLYETLARYQWWRRRWSRALPGEALEIRKRLTASTEDPSDSGEAFDRWLYRAAAMPSGGAVLDLGCGFGASLLRWVDWSGGTGIGVTASRVQARRATAEAARRELEHRCRFLVQDFTAPVEATHDVVCAIEALGHAFDLAEALANVRRALVPGGRFAWVEDLTVQPCPDDIDVADLARRWASPPLRDVASARAALEVAGLSITRENDLTDRVAVSDSARLDRRAANLLRWRTMVPFSPWRRLADAFLGGCALERLYARGRACYVVFICERLA